MAGTHRLGIAEISKTYGWLVPAPVTMLILSGRVICAMSSDTRCATGSDWFSHGQAAVAAVVLAVPPAWAVWTEWGVESDYSVSASAAAAVVIILNNQRFLTPGNDFTTPPITAQLSHDIVSSQAPHGERDNSQQP